MKKHTNITFLILLGIIPSLTSAEILPQASVNANVGARAEVLAERKAAMVEARQDFRASTTVLTDEMKKARAEFQASVKNRTASSSEVVKEKRQDLIKFIQDKRDVFKAELDARRDAMASTTADIRAKFKLGLDKIKDENKKERIQKAGENLLELNARIVASSSERVNKIEEVIVALETKADKSSLDSVNVANVRAHIANVEDLIVQARAAISLQAGKTYSVNVSSDASAQAELKASRDQLKKDVDVMNAKIKAAHDGAKKAVNALKRILPKASVQASTTLAN